MFLKLYFPNIAFTSITFIKSLTKPTSQSWRIFLWIQYIYLFITKTQSSYYNRLLKKYCTALLPARLTYLQGLHVKHDGGKKQHVLEENIASLESWQTYLFCLENKSIFVQETLSLHRQKIKTEQLRCAFCFCWKRFFSAAQFCQNNSVNKPHEILFT